MLSKLMERGGAYVGRMSQRERNLAYAVAALLCLMVCVSVTRGALGYVWHLDSTIDRLQEDIVNYRYSIAHRQEVEASYARVAKQHSSAWTEAEIHDRLRQEIYRLAQMTPPALDENGIPVQINASGGTLVDIPTLREGVLLEGGEDFRQYQLGFRIERAPFNSVIAFIERLQNSPQSLRIDDLLIARTSIENEVSARMEITRTVVNGAPEENASDVVEEVMSKGRDSAPLNPEAWNAVACSLSPNEEFAFHDEAALEVVSNGPQASVYFERDVESGFSYDMFVEVTAFEECQLGVMDVNGGASFEAPYTLPGDGQPYRYHVRFTVPGEIGGGQKLRTPALQFAQPGARAVVSRLVIKKAVG